MNIPYKHYMLVLMDNDFLIIVSNNTYSQELAVVLAG